MLPIPAVLNWMGEILHPSQQYIYFSVIRMIEGGNKSLYNRPQLQSKISSPIGMEPRPVQSSAKPIVPSDLSMVHIDCSN